MSRAGSLPVDVDREQWVKSSEAALETITKIMTDVAKHHLEYISRSGVDCLAFCCACNLRVAIKHIEDRCKHGFVCKSLLGGLGYLKALETVFNMRWKFNP